MAAQKLGERMHNDIGAMVDRLAQIWRCQRVIDDEWNAGAARDFRYRLDVGDDAAGIGNRLDENRFCLRADGALERADVVGIGPHHVPAETLEGMIELVDRAAIQLARRDEFISWPQ